MVTYRSCVPDRVVALLRRALVVTVATLSLVAPVVVGSPASAAGGYDQQVGASECDLLGRVYTKGQGCSRTRCVQGAKLFRKFYGAEACQLRNQGDYGFVSTVDFRLCGKLHRRWIAEVNYCASYPDRSVTAVYDAPQCKGSADVYVPLSEKEGYFDECMTSERVRYLTSAADRHRTSLATEAALHSSTQCGNRPEHKIVNDMCVAAPGTRPSHGGVLMVGDSLTWRGTDELARLRPTYTIDGEPARQISDLKSRLDYYVAGHGEPTGLIIAMGAVPPPKSFGRSDLSRVVKSLPRSTDVMFVLPYAEFAPGKPTKGPTIIASWMKSIAKGRGNMCLADWPSFVRAHRGILQDGVHVKHPSEGTWASFISQQWSRC
jgi:hypothetical protein